MLDLIATAGSELQVLLGVSGYSYDDIAAASNAYAACSAFPPVLMFGFQSFPTDPAQVNLSRIALLKERLSLPIGYADHCAWDSDAGPMLAAATALGADFLEKHVILEAGQKRVDYESAVSCADFDRLAALCRPIVTAMGEASRYALSDAERRYGDRRLRCVARHDIAAGTPLTAENTLFQLGCPWNDYSR